MVLIICLCPFFLRRKKKCTVGGSEVKASAGNVGDLGSIPGSGRCPGEGNGNPLQYSCLGNPMDRGAWWTVVHGVTRVRYDLETEPPNMSWQRRSI